MSKHFDESAKEWDKKQRRVLNAQKIAAAIKEQISFSPEDKILDFGTGTGLLAWEIAPLVGEITGVDTSKEMLKIFASKDWPCKISTANIELHQTLPSDKYDAIISSMTLHHVKDIPAYLRAFNHILKEEGYLAIADLDKEDGTFHTSGNEGVFHLGFDQSDLKIQLQKAGFHNITFKIVNILQKETEDGGQKEFPIFLVLARKR